MGSRLQHGCHGSGLGVGDKPETAGSAGLVLHEHSGLELAVLSKVGLEGLVGGLAGNTPNKKLSVTLQLGESLLFCSLILYRPITK